MTPAVRTSDHPCLMEMLEPRLLLSTATFGTYTGPELDFYQPCNGGDNNINFQINVHDVDVATIQSAKLKLAVWDVDYNCGGACDGLCERDEVLLNGHKLTTPQPYLTGADNQWSTVTFDVSPSFIKSGDNRVDINIDLLSGWCWCVMCDYGELIIETGAKPTIEDIVIDGTPDVWWNPWTWGVDPNPTTTKDVEFTAKLKDMTGYEVVKIAWTSDAFNPQTTTTDSLTVKPMAGRHGKGKDIQAILTYRKIGETQTYTTKPYSEKFDLFFDKQGDDNGDGEDNWFDYWSTSSDGACSFGSGQASFSYIYGDGPYSPYSLRGQTWSGTGKIQIFNAATTTQGFTWSKDGLTINEHKGIDQLEFILQHERTHNVVEWNWKEGGAWWPSGGTKFADQDQDRIPDVVEDTVPGFDKTKPQSFPGYPISGGSEEEVYCDYIAETSRNSPVPTQDWANPGKQTSPSYCYLPAPTLTGTDASLAGTISDRGEDSDGDGRYETLVVDVPVDVQVAGRYYLQSSLLIGSNRRVSASGEYDLASGSSTVSLKFDGRAIRQARTSGPYSVEFVFLGGQTGELGSIEGPISTEAYDWNQFSTGEVSIEAGLSDVGVDSDGDGQFNLLDVSVPVTYHGAGAGSLYGWLVDDAGVELGYARADFTATDGGSDTVHLLFGGEPIRQKQRSGTYHLRYLTAELDGQPVDSLYEAHVSQAYSWTQFEATGGAFQSATQFTNQGVDLDGNGLFDVLRINMKADIATTGRYVVVGRLLSSDGVLLGEASIDRALPAGSQTLALDFGGRNIAELKKAGPYHLEYAYLYDGTGSLLDAMPVEYTTAAYDWRQFEGVSVMLTGAYTDQGIDTNSDGIFDLLRITVGVKAINAGTFALNGRLMDQQGHEIAWASASSSFTAGQTKTLVLDFPAAAISANGVNGPYFLRDLYVYNTSDATQNDYVYEAMTTRFYGVGDFRPLMNLNSRVTMVAARSSFDRRTGQQTTMIRITNTSTQTIVSPSRLVINSLTPNVTVVNADAKTPRGKPYICLGCLIPQGQLRPGQSVLVPLVFSNPLNVRFTFDLLLEGLLQA